MGALRARLFEPFWLLEERQCKIVSYLVHSCDLWRGLRFFAEVMIRIYLPHVFLSLLFSFFRRLHGVFLSLE
jgi:hypothetical protein